MMMMMMMHAYWTGGMCQRYSIFDLLLYRVSEWLIVGNFVAKSWQEQTTDGWDTNIVRFLQDQNAQLYCHSVSSLK